MGVKETKFKLIVPTRSPQNLKTTEHHPNQSALECLVHEKEEARARVAELETRLREACALVGTMEAELGVLNAELDRERCRNAEVLSPVAVAPTTLVGGVTTMVDGVTRAMVGGVAAEGRASSAAASEAGGEGGREVRTAEEEAEGHLKTPPDEEGVTRRESDDGIASSRDARGGRGALQVRFVLREQQQQLSFADDDDILDARTGFERAKTRDNVKETTRSTYKPQRVEQESIEEIDVAEEATAADVSSQTNGSGVALNRERQEGAGLDGSRVALQEDEMELGAQVRARGI